MKILHILTQDWGGAGNAGYRLNLGLNTIGVDSKMLTLSKKSGDSTVLGYLDNPIGGRMVTESNGEHIPHSYSLMWSKWLKILQNYLNRPEGLEIFTTTDCFVDYTLVQEIEDADIINFHWVAGSFDYKNAAATIGNKPIVWTLHDMNSFTGGCHYAVDCLKYKTECKACPQLGSKMNLDLSNEGWNTKNKFYKDLNITIVTPSKWLGRCSQESALLGDRRHEVIPYGFPLDKFNPKDKMGLRKNLGIPANQKIVLFGADHIGNKRKGLSYLIDALKLLVGKYDDLAFAFFGKFPENFALPFEIPMYNFGSIKELDKISAVYSLADVFVLPSLEDNLPNTVVEAMASGTPVVGFDIGGVPDMIVHKQTGYLAKEKDINSLAEGIKWVLYESNLPVLEANCVNRAQTEYPLHLQAERYKALYEELLSGSDKGQTQSKPEADVRETVAEIRKEVNVNTLNQFPKLTFVTPSYNHARYLDECIDSVLSQNYPNLEYVVMDGGSTDGSADIIKKYEKHLHHWQSAKDGGQYDAINNGFKKSDGELMGWINSDDMILPHAFQRVASLFLDYPDIDWITGHPSMIGEASGNMLILDLKFWSRKKYLNQDYKFIQQESTFWRRKLYDVAGGYISTEFDYAGDLELWSRFFRHAHLYSVDALLGTFRKHFDQKSSEFIKEYIEEADQIIDREIDYFNANPVGLEDPPSLIYMKNVKIKPIRTNEVNFEELKSALRIKDFRTVKRISSEMIAQNQEIPQLADILAAAETQLGNTSKAKTILWNNILKYTDHEDSYHNLLNLEISECRVDNMINLMNKMTEHGIVLDNIEEYYKRIQGYHALIVELVTMLKYSIAEDDVNAQRSFNKAREILIYFFKDKWRGYNEPPDMDEMKKMVKMIGNNIESLNMMRVFDIISNKFNVKFNFNYQ